MKKPPMEAAEVLRLANRRKAPGLILVLSGPSGVGKGTLIRMIARDIPDLVYAPSYTTRPRRRANVSEKKYFYVSPERFKELKKEGKLLESAEIYGNWYGLSKDHVLKAEAQGKVVILEVDVQGAATLKKQGLQGCYCFILPPSHKELERRLKLRATEDPASLQARIKNMNFEIAQAIHYDFWLVNEEPGQAAEDLKALVRANRLRAPGKK